ncbi:MAG: bifunctional hydroxymethylpyrimidine kinase/phosphomethylpyrimidine kinase [Desulfobacterales bacterium]
MKKILTIAGSDSGGGAGIQADLKTITVLGGFGTSVITALTAQNTLGVQGIFPVPTDFIRRQMDSVLSDIGADAVKTGMLASMEIVEAVAWEINDHQLTPLVVDPVMVAKSGNLLLSENARETLKKILLPLAFVVTPNLAEAEILCGFAVNDTEKMKDAAKKIYDFGPKNVLIKGGHLKGLPIDILYDGLSFQAYEAPRLSQRNTHGTGCTFSAALTTFLSQKMPIHQATIQAKAFITNAIFSGIAIGSGHGPTNPYSYIATKMERENILNDLKTAVHRLTISDMGKIIPECRSNLAYASTFAAGFEDVAAFPGRITNAGDHIFTCREPAFGATRHMARVVLAVMPKAPEIRSAMNIRYTPSFIDACHKASLRTVSFDRRFEPPEIKEKEGSTLEWGTSEAMKKSTHTPDCIYDKGEVGKEPMIRVLGKNPMDVVEKICRIYQVWQHQDNHNQR